MIFLRLIRLIFLLTIVVVIIVFALANHHDTSLSFSPLPYQFSLPLYLPILSALLIGILIGALFIASRTLALRYKIHTLKRKLSSSQDKLSHLENTINMPPHSIPHAEKPQDLTTKKTTTTSENNPSQDRSQAK